MGLIIRSPRQRGRAARPLIQGDNEYLASAARHSASGRPSSFLTMLVPSTIETILYPACRRPMPSRPMPQSDEYTLLLVVPANAISATLYDNLNFNFIRDITPVVSLLRVPFVMVVNPSFPAKTVPEFITYAKANPGEVKWASTGNATVTHVAGELFKMMAGVNMVNVPYRGDPHVDLLGRQVDVYFSPMPASIEYIKAGKLHGLAVTTATRSEALPDTPTVDEFVPGYESSGWYGIGGPTGTPAEIVNKLNNEINAALADPQLKARLADLGGTVIAGSPSDFGSFVAAETEQWAKVVRFAGIKPE